jgi:hypothetical protein
VELALTRDQTLTILNFGALFFFFVFPVWMVWQFHAAGVLIGAFVYWVFGIFLYSMINQLGEPYESPWGAAFHFVIGWIPPIIYGFIVVFIKNALNRGRKQP